MGKGQDDLGRSELVNVGVRKFGSSVSIYLILQESRLEIKLEQNIDCRKKEIFSVVR